MSPLDSFRSDYRQKKVLIFGLGLLGRGVGDAEFFHQIGCQVRVTDLKNETELAPSLKRLAPYDLSFTLGQHKKEDIDWADVVVRNASVPYHHELLDYARSVGKSVVMEDALFVKYAGIPTIGVTGTRGKTTTTTMIFEILKQHSGRHILLGGNIAGVATLPLLQEIDSQNNTVAVLELSSWQLQGFNDLKLSPHVAVITNIYPDHLNTYANMTDYIEDKKHIFHHQSASDHLFLNKDQAISSTFEPEIKSTIHWFSAGTLPQELKLSLLGEHNRENAAAALGVASFAGIAAEKSYQTLAGIRPVPFRLEEVREVNGIRFINDTTSTTPVATIKALDSFAENLTLILGGNDKKLPTDELLAKINQKNPTIVLLSGTGTNLIKNSLNQDKIVGEFSLMDEAVRAAYAHTSSPGIVLLSPGFTSFGSFKNEFDRGNQFNQAVTLLT